jgi:hypothetical protein
MVRLYANAIKSTSSSLSISCGLKFSIGAEAIQEIPLPVDEKFVLGPCLIPARRREKQTRNDGVVLGHRRTLPLYNVKTLFFSFLCRLYKELDFILISISQLSKKCTTCCGIRNKIGCAHHAPLCWCRKVLLFMPSNSSDLELIHFLLYERVSERVTEWGE